MDSKLRPYLIGGVVGTIIGIVLGGTIASCFYINRYKEDRITGTLLTNKPGSIKVMSTTRLIDSTGAPVNQGRPVTQLRSDFTIKEGSASVPSIVSHGTGGACYLADLEVAEWPRRKTPPTFWGNCTASSDCNPCTAPDKKDCNDKLQNWPDANWQGYCVKETPGTSEGKCWVRPGIPATHCLRSLDKNMKAWPLDQPQNLPVIDADIGHGIDPNSITWRVQTCLNGVDPKNPFWDIGGCPVIRVGPKFKLPQP